MKGQNVWTRQQSKCRDTLILWLVQTEVGPFIRRDWPPLYCGFLWGESKRESVYSITSRAEMHKRPTDRSFLRSLFERNKTTSFSFYLCIGCPTNHFSIKRGSVGKTDRRYWTTPIKRNLGLRLSTGCSWFVGNYFSFFFLFFLFPERIQFLCFFSLWLFFYHFCLIFIISNLKQIRMRSDT